MFGIPEVDVGGRCGVDGWKSVFLVPNNRNTSTRGKVHDTPASLDKAAAAANADRQIGRASVGGVSLASDAAKRLFSRNRKELRQDVRPEDGKEQRRKTAGGGGGEPTRQPAKACVSDEPDAHEADGRRRSAASTVNSGFRDPVQVKLPPASTFHDLLEKAGNLLQLSCPSRVFLSDGAEVFDMTQVPDDEVLYISEGDDFDKANNSEQAVVGGYIIKEKLGEGGFGKVVKGVHAETGDVVAVKLISKRSFKEVTDADRVFVEIQALRDLSHKHVIKMYDVIDHPDYICFIMEYASNGELRRHVFGRNCLPEEEARVYFEQLVKGVHYCHSKNIVHRDLKLENILLDDQYKCKIADFGLSEFVPDSYKTLTEGGTEAYLAPEVWNGTSRQCNPFKIDVWALGVILYAMTHGKLPFQKPDKETIDVIRMKGIQFNDQISTTLRRAIASMLTPDPASRVSINDVMNDRWLRQSMPWQKRLSLSDDHLKAVASPNSSVPYSNTSIVRLSSSATTESVSSWTVCLPLS